MMELIHLSEIAFTGVLAARSAMVVGRLPSRQKGHLGRSRKRLRTCLKRAGPCHPLSGSPVGSLISGQRSLLGSLTDLHHTSPCAASIDSHFLATTPRSWCLSTHSRDACPIGALRPGSASIVIKSQISSAVLA